MTLTFTNLATDPEGPPQLLTFALDAGTVTNALLNPTNGIFTWTPDATQIGTNTFTITVTDNGLPPLSDTKDFFVVVLPRPNVSLRFQPMPSPSSGTPFLA